MYINGSLYLYWRLTDALPDLPLIGPINRYGVRQVFVNQAQVQKADVGCTNGIVHIINRVLIPPSLL